MTTIISLSRAVRWWTVPRLSTLAVLCLYAQVFGRSQSMPGTEALLTKPVEKQHTDTVVNFLIRIACQVVVHKNSHRSWHGIKHKQTVSYLLSEPYWSVQQYLHKLNPALCLQVNDSTNVAGSPGELLSRRCVNLMKTALRPDMWPRAELKLQWFDKLLMTVVSLNACEFWSIFFYSPIRSYLYQFEAGYKICEFLAHCQKVSG